TIGVGQFQSSISRISTSYHEALEAIEMKYFVGGDKILKFSEVCPEESSRPQHQHFHGNGHSTGARHPGNQQIACRKGVARRI
ncbi:MAG: hypothetical protein N2322_05400, partial [Terrimicrobiaceae bacterium]|nr:hypothetical protein [Terrimicrobiaceae bacterium]